MNNLSQRDPINSLSSYLKARFGKKVLRIAVDLGFTCPNRDGTAGKGGCIFCDHRGSRADYVNPRLSVREQIVQRINSFKSSESMLFIAYFQAFTHTYGPIEKLEEGLKEALSIKNIVGVALATRPDALPDEILVLLKDFRKKYTQKIFFLELGVQSFNPSVLRWMNRGHGLLEILEGTHRAILTGWEPVAHMIFGSPGESIEDYEEYALLLSYLGYRGVKMHHLYVLKNTVLEELYYKGKFKPLRIDEYIEIAIRFLEHLKPDIVIHRIAGSATSGLVAPEWTRTRGALIWNRIREEMKKRNTYQGKLFRGPSIITFSRRASSEGDNP